MAKRQIAISVQTEGVRETVAAFRHVPKDVNEELREASLKLSELLARKVRAAGAAQGRQAALLARTVKATPGAVPNFTVGGTERIGHAWPKGGRAPAFKLLFGSEFGATTGHGFKSRRKSGYWIYPTVERERPAIDKAYLEAADEIVDKFTAPGAR